MTTLRAWLTDQNPASRRQAKLGQMWLAWLRIRRNRLAMAGLIIVGILFLVALLAPWIAPHDPFVQNLANRSAPRHPATRWPGRLGAAVSHVSDHARGKYRARDRDPRTRA